MNTAFLRSWAAELRSGNWEQNIGGFYGRGNRRCAVGVAFELASGHYSINKLSLSMSSAIALKNDAGESFAQIATYLDDLANEADAAATITDAERHIHDHAAVLV